MSATQRNASRAQRHIPLPLLLMLGGVSGLAAYWAMGLGVAPWAVLAAVACFLIVAGVVGTRRELRRREALIEAALGSARRSTSSTAPNTGPALSSEPKTAAEWDKAVKDAEAKWRRGELDGDELTRIQNERDCAKGSTWAQNCS